MMNFSLAACCYSRLVVHVQHSRNSNKNVKYVYYNMYLHLISISTQSLNSAITQVPTLLTSLIVRTSQSPSIYLPTPTTSRSNTPTNTPHIKYSRLRGQCSHTWSTSITPRALSSLLTRKTKKKEKKKERKKEKCTIVLESALGYPLLALDSEQIRRSAKHDVVPA